MKNTFLKLLNDAKDIITVVAIIEQNGIITKNTLTNSTLIIKPLYSAEDINEEVEYYKKNYNAKDCSEKEFFDYFNKHKNKFSGLFKLIEEEKK